MLTNRHLKKFLYGFFAIFLTMVFWGQNSFGAFTLGNTYDKNNWEEIKTMLPEPVLNWVKKGEFKIQTGKLDYELTLDEKYLKESQKNEGKYDINKEGVLVEKSTGKEPNFVYGNPFPTIDSQDPKVAEKIMDNFKFTIHYRLGSSQSQGQNIWVGESGMERFIVATENYLYYQNRSGGPVANPNNFLYQLINLVKEPFDLRGTVMMAWTYNSAQTDTAFAYVPMLRRIRRTSAAARSDPFAGSDLCVDDMLTWAGKNASMKWKLLGEGTILSPFSSAKKGSLNRNPDGSIERDHDVVIAGYESPGWEGVPWAPVSIVWHPRPVWIVEAVPKDPYYNYGRTIYYVDKENYMAYFKIAYDQSGQYWKTIYNASSCYETNDGERYIGLLHFIVSVDDKTHHATLSPIKRSPNTRDKFNMTIEEFGPEFFSESNIRGMSK